MNLHKLFDDMKNGLIYENLDLKQLISEIGARPLIDALLENIGNTNQLIRENILSINYRLASEGALEHQDYIYKLNICLSENYLFKNIDGGESDAVFVRSFTSLAIAWIISADSKMGFLSDDEYKNALDAAISYMAQETDRRGYIAQKGWAHAIAHISNMLGELIKHPKFPAEYAEKILDGIKLHIVSSKHPYADGEEARFTKMVVLPLLNKGTSEQQIKDWMHIQRMLNMIA
ncbi:MAG: DUF2785 domain-containing protein [Defluviitaleaceae bacterium]|nr:DUF2785 domain-containing protein [Defluviitaleaceae bacterium]